jgi:hypothetical protein
MLFREALLPLFVQVALIFGLLFWMGSARVGAIRRREVRMADIALIQSNWPPRIQQIGNCYGNQFQLPVLYLVLTALVMILRKADIVFVVLAWIFVLSRVVHAAIHTTSNDVRLRFYGFLFGAIVLLLMWIIFAVQALIGV